jgi:hypothetical protein
VNSLLWLASVAAGEDAPPVVNRLDFWMAALLLCAIIVSIHVLQSKRQRLWQTQILLAVQDSKRLISVLHGRHDSHESKLADHERRIRTLEDSREA